MAHAQTKPLARLAVSKAKEFILLFFFAKGFFQSARAPANNGIGRFHNLPNTAFRKTKSIKYKIQTNINSERHSK
jgi:hypothetical protein